jgi:hypothetical protein
MAEIKYYTANPNTCPLHSKNHRLVRAASERGLTKVLILFYPRGYIKKGWYIQSDQVPVLHLGHEIAEAETRIRQISI